MARLLQQRSTTRASRVKLLGSVLALVQLPNGRRVRARLHQLSANGGVLRLHEALDEAISTQLMFHVRSTTMRTNVEMLFPMWATRGCLQPFRFTDLGEEQRGKLEVDLQSLLNNSTPAPWTGEFARFD